MRVLCYTCNVVLERVPSAIRDRNFCSRSCLGKGKVNKPKTSKEVVCTTCGIKFTRELNAIKDKNYCSRVCQHNRKIDHNTINCTMCGTKFRRSPAYVKDKNFCSTKCFAKFEVITGIRSKRTHNNWVYGKYDNFDHQTNRGNKTIYGGVTMKSKLEARCAKLLDSQNIIWEYEPKRFDLETTTYTPDFYLPEFNYWLETKYGKNFDDNLYKVELLIKLGENIIVVRNEEITKIEKELENV